MLVLNNKQDISAKKFKPFLTQKDIDQVKDVIVYQKTRLHTLYYTSNESEKIIQGLEQLIALNGAVENIDEAIKIIEVSCSDFLTVEFGIMGELISKFRDQQYIDVKNSHPFFVQNGIDKKKGLIEKSSESKEPSEYTLNKKNW